MARIMDWSFILNEDPKDVKVKAGDTVSLPNGGGVGKVVKTDIRKNKRKVTIRANKTGAEYVVEANRGTKAIQSGYSGRYINASGRPVTTPQNTKKTATKTKTKATAKTTSRGVGKKAAPVLIAPPTPVLLPPVPTSAPAIVAPKPVVVTPKPAPAVVAPKPAVVAPKPASSATPKKITLIPQVQTPSVVPAPGGGGRYVMKRPALRSQTTVSGMSGNKLGATMMDLVDIEATFRRSVKDASALTWSSNGLPMRNPTYTTYLMDKSDSILTNPKLDNYEKARAMMGLYESHRYDIERQLRLDEKDAKLIKDRDLRADSQHLFGLPSRGNQYGGLTEAKFRMSNVLGELTSRGVYDSATADNIMQQFDALTDQMTAIGGKDNWSKLANSINSHEKALEKDIKARDREARQLERSRRSLIRWTDESGVVHHTNRSSMIDKGLKMLSDPMWSGMGNLTRMRVIGNDLRKAYREGDESKLKHLSSWYRDVVAPFNEDRKAKGIAKAEKAKRFQIGNRTYSTKDMGGSLMGYIDALDYVSDAERQRRRDYAQKLIRDRHKAGGARRLASYLKSQEKQYNKERIQRKEEGRRLVTHRDGLYSALTPSEMIQALPSILNARGFGVGTSEYDSIMSEAHNMKGGEGYAKRVGRLYQREVEALRRTDLERNFNLINAQRSADLLGGSRLFDPTNSAHVSEEINVLRMAAKRAGVDISAQTNMWDTISKHGTKQQKLAMAGQMERLSSDISKQLTPAQMIRLSSEYASAFGGNKRLYGLSAGIADENAMRLYNLRQQRLNRWSLQKEIFTNALSPFGEKKNGRTGLRLPRLGEAANALASMIKYNPGHAIGALGSAAMSASKAIISLGMIAGGVAAFISGALLRQGIITADNRTTLRNKYNLATPTAWKNGMDYNAFEAKSFGTARTLRTDAYAYQKGILDMAMAVGGARYQTGANAGKSIVTSLDQVETMNKNLTMMARATGTDSQTLEAVLTQLYQGIGKGKLDTQDIKPLLNQSAAFGDMLAREVFGLAGGRSELFAAMDAGSGDRNEGLTAEKLITGLLNPSLSRKMQDVYRNTARTWEEVGTVIKSDMKQALAPFVSGFGAASGGSFGSGLLGFTQSLAEDSTVNGKTFGDAMWEALGMGALQEKNVPSLMTELANGFGKLIKIGGSLIQLAMFLGGAFGMVASAASGVVFVITAFVGLVGDAIAGLGKIIANPLNPEEWKLKPYFAESALNMVGASMTAAEGFYGLTQMGPEIGETMRKIGGVLEDLDASNASYAENAMGSEINNLSATADVTAKDVGEIKKSTAKITGIQIAMLKQISGQAVINRVTRVVPNIVTNIGTIKSGMEYSELETRLKSTISSAIANAY